MERKPKAADLDALPVPILECRPDWVELYQVAWRIASRNIRHSRGRDHMDAAWDPARNFQWVWDTSFMTLFCRYGNGQFPGIESLDNFYDLQRDDGYISMTYDLNKGVEVWGERINPPLFAWAEWEYATATGDQSRFGRVVPHIEKLMEWIELNRKTEPHRKLTSNDNSDDERGGSVKTYQLYYFEDGGSSGMDDSPRTPRVKEAGRHVDWIDLSAQMVLSFRMLANIHRVLGNGDRADHWEQKADATAALINEELWCPRTRFYHDRMIPRNFNASKTAAGFWPILGGVCGADRLDSLVGHLLDPDEFNTSIPVPTLSKDDCNYDPEGTYWIGGVWAPTNYMITRGLMRAGRGRVAHDIAAKYLDGLARTYREFEPHSLWECNGPERPRPGLKPYGREFVKPDFVGWSGLGPIAMLIENILGFDLDAMNRKLTWDIRLPGVQGIRNLVFGGKPVDLVAEPDGGRMRLTIRGENPFTLNVNRGKASRSIDFKGGELKLEI